MDEISGWIILLFVASAFVFAVYLDCNPKSRLSRGFEAFWETPAIKRLRMVMWKTFWVLFLGWLALVAIEDRFNRAGIRDSDVEHFLRMAGVIALVVGMAL